MRHLLFAQTIDKKYAELLREAYKCGVEILVYQCKMDLRELGLGKSLPFDLG